MPTANRRHRNVTAYDAIQDIVNTDVAEWYNTIFPGDTTRVQLKDLRDSFFQYLNIPQEATTLPNDDMWISKTVDVVEISGMDIITAICELNGCFGHMGRDAIFHYVFLQEITEESGWVEINPSFFIQDVEYQDYVVRKIDQLKILQSESGDYFTYGEGVNPYYIEDNLFLYGYSESELAVIAANILNVIKDISYTPVQSATALGNPTLLVGSGIKVQTRYATIYTSILHRSMSGVQQIIDQYDASGTEFWDTDLNSVDRQIIQLKGLINQVDNSAFHFNTIRNAKVVDVGDGQSRRVIQANILTKADAQVKVEIQILLETALSALSQYAIGTVTYVLDGETLELTPIETWIAGKHVLCLLHYMDITDAGYHRFDVYLTMAGGSAHIDPLNALEIFTGTGLVEEPGWGGVIELEDDAPVFVIPEIGFAGATDAINIRFIAPIRITASDSAPVFAIPEIGFDSNVLDSLTLIKHLEQSGRVTEDGDVRVTENGDARYTEEEV